MSSHKANRNTTRNQDPGSDDDDDDKESGANKHPAKWNKPDDDDPNNGQLTDFEAEKEALIQEAQNLVLPEFDPKQLKPDALCMVVGKRRFGKSTFCRWVMSEIWDRYPDGGYVFTTTKHNWFWQQHFPDSRIYNGFDWETINGILDVQLEKWKEVQMTGEKKVNYIMLIFDDCISERKDARYAEELLRQVFNGRHYMISIWLLTQDIKGFFPDVRANTDFAFLTYQIQDRQITAAKNDWADFFPDKHTFAQLLRRETQDHGILCIDQSEAKYSLKDGIFYHGQANPDPPPFKFGTTAFWKEAGCVWEEQVRIWNNVQKAIFKDNEEVVKFAMIKWNEDKKEQKQQEEDQWDELRTADFSAAVGEQADFVKKLLAKKTKSGWTPAAVKEKELDDYVKRIWIPNTKGYIPTQSTRSKRR